MRPATVFLAMFLMATALAVVVTKHRSRELSISLDQLNAEYGRMALQRDQLELEVHALSQHGRIEPRAVASHGFKEPDEIVVVSSHGR